MMRLIEFEIDFFLSNKMNLIQSRGSLIFIVSIKYF